MSKASLELISPNFFRNSILKDLNWLSTGITSRISRFVKGFQLFEKVYKTNTSVNKAMDSFYRPSYLVISTQCR